MNLFPKWNAQSAARWEKKRAAGKTRFALRWGLVWGLIMTALMTVEHTVSTPDSSLLRNLPFNLIVFLGAGMLFGILMWNMLEGAYRSYLSRQELESLDKLNARS